MKVHVNIIVSGKVQRIGFRYSTLEVASQLGITGFVKNLADGKVYIEAEGEEEAVKAFIRWCHDGPPWADVQEVDIEKAAMKNFTVFEIIG